MLQNCYAGLVVLRFINCCRPRHRINKRLLMELFGETLPFAGGLFLLLALLMALGFEFVNDDRLETHCRNGGRENLQVASYLCSRGFGRTCRNGNDSCRGPS